VAGAPPTAVALDRFVAGGSVTFAVDSKGGVACWQRDSGLVRTWDRQGTPRATCRLTDPRLPAEAHIMGYDDGKALLTFFDFDAGSETLRKGVIVDTDACTVAATFSIPGVAHAVLPIKDGWVVLTRDPFRPGSQFLRLDSNGAIVDAFSLDREFEAVTSTHGFDRNPLNYLGTPVTAGRDLWIIPHDNYELWYPPQRGRSFRRVEPPECLAAPGQVLRGEAEAERIRMRAQAFPEPYRTSLAASSQSGSLGPIVVSATAGAVTSGDLLAVKVMDHRLATGARVDVWNLATESIVGVFPFGANVRLLALSEAGAWIIEDGKRLRLLPVPDLSEPAGDACGALKAAELASERLEVHRVASRITR
jgi:hypothetical protein